MLQPAKGLKITQARAAQKFFDIIQMSSPPFSEMSNLPFSEMKGWDTFDGPFSAVSKLIVFSLK